MATITSEVFRFVNLRGPSIKKNEAATALPIVRPKPIARAKTKPSVITQAKWDDLLIQRLIAAKENPENENRQRAAMLEILDAIDEKDIPGETVYIDSGFQEVVDFATWIDINQNVLDKATLRSRFIDLYNRGEETETPIGVEDYQVTIESENIVSVELAIWDALVATTLKVARPKFAEAAVRAIKLLHLAKQLSDYEAFPTESKEIYAIFNAPIDLPSEIFPLPEAEEPAAEEVQPDPLDQVLADTKTDLTKWTAAQTTLAFVRAQLQEKQQQLLHDFIIVYDAEGQPTNLDETPKTEQIYLTAATLDTYTQRCATTIATELTTGKALLNEHYLCTPTARYSFDYMEKEIAEIIKKTQQKIATLTPRKVQKTVFIDGTIFSFEEEVRGSL